jgi:hypothetical protein
VGVDYPGNDIAKCTGSETPFQNGCIMAADATYLDCEAMCNNTKVRVCIYACTLPLTVHSPRVSSQLCRHNSHF